MSRRLLCAISFVAIATGPSIAATKDCPTLDGDKILELMDRAPTCAESRALFEACSHGASGDVGLSEVVIRKCEGDFLTKLSKSQRQAYYDLLNRNGARASTRINPAPCTVLSRPSAAPIWRGITRGVLPKARNLEDGSVPSGAEWAQNGDFARLSGRQRGLCLVDDGFERRRLVDGEVRKHFAIDRDPGFAETGDKSAVGQSEPAHGGVEPLGSTALGRMRLTPLAVAKAYWLTRFSDRLLGYPDECSCASHNNPWRL